MKTKKGALQIPFAWLFAIIVGIVIIFLAIYTSARAINLGQYEIDSKTAKNIGILLNPLETGLETGETTPMSLPVETKIYNRCGKEGYFGSQLIQVSQKSFNKWPEPSEAVSFPNKYIFSEKTIEGKEFYLFSKPFNFPFKVADLIYMTSAGEKYCFIEPPEKIKMEISNLGIKNVFLGDCPEESINVCFPTGSDCDIKVRGDRVEKGMKTMYFTDNALMYAAIFSDPDVYECHLKRLMQRTKQLALLYNEKAIFIFQTSGCNSDLALIQLSNVVDTLETSANLNFINNLVKDVGKKNEGSFCKLW